MAPTYQLEKEVAISAVLRACSLTSSVFNTLVKGEVITKEDKSPVTIGDFSAQAVINTILVQAFPDDPIVGEEDAHDLRDKDTTSTESHNLMLDRINALANEALIKPLLPWEKPEWGVGAKRSIDQLLEAIDRGNYGGGRTGRMWVLDPIDGTKGFLRGEQYAVCLALVVDGVAQLGVLGCPNLPVSPSDATAGQGVIVLAVRGQGAWQAAISSLSAPTKATTFDALLTPIHIPSATPPADKLRTLESVEAAHSAQGFTAAIARGLNLTAPPNRMDSQAKYAALARGMDEGHLYLRMPVPGKNYIEKIWDHAAGNVIITEAGGIVSDSYGAPLDFGLGRTLGENKGIIACAPGIHDKVVEAIRGAREGEGGESGKL